MSQSEKTEPVRLFALMQTDEDGKTRMLTVSATREEAGRSLRDMRLDAALKSMGITEEKIADAIDKLKVRYRIVQQKLIDDSD